MTDFYFNFTNGSAEKNNYLEQLLNQARRPVAGVRLVSKIDPVRIVSMRACVRVCVCVRAQGY